MGRGDVLCFLFSFLLAALHFETWFHCGSCVNFSPLGARFLCRCLFFFSSEESHVWRVAIDVM